MPAQYIRDPHESCVYAGCQYPVAIECLRRAQQVLDASKVERKQEMAPAVSLYCEIRDHSFSSKKGHVELERRVFNGEGNVESTETITSCILHDPYAPKDEPDAITSGTDDRD